MHPARLVVAALALLAAAGCGPPPEAFCGLPSAVPAESEVGDGEGEALLDGNTFLGDASYGVGPNASLTVGLLDMGLVADTTGTSVVELVERGAFPVCVELGQRTDTTMAAIDNDGGLTTNETHGGALSILAAEGDILVGRFEVEVANGGTTRSYTDGVFRATKR